MVRVAGFQGLRVWGGCSCFGFGGLEGKNLRHAAASVSPLRAAADAQMGGFPKIGDPKTVP